MTEILCSFLNFMRDAITNHFPSLSIESGNLTTMLNAFESIIEFIAQINFLVPLPTILLVTSLVYGIKLVKFGIFLVNWVVRRLADVF